MVAASTLAAQPVRIVSLSRLVGVEGLLKGFHFQVVLADSGQYVWRKGGRREVYFFQIFTHDISKSGNFYSFIHVDEIIPRNLGINSQESQKSRSVI